jgi:hypothetical protein
MVRISIAIQAYQYSYSLFIDRELSYSLGGRGLAVFHKVYRQSCLIVQATADMYIAMHTRQATKPQRSNVMPVDLFSLIMSWSRRDNGSM